MIFSSRLALVVTAVLGAMLSSLPTAAAEDAPAPIDGAAHLISVRNATALDCLAKPELWTGVDATTVWSVRILRDGQPMVAGTTAASYTPAASDVNHELTCEVSAASALGSAVRTETGIVANAGKYLSPVAVLSSASLPVGFFSNLEPQENRVRVPELASGMLRAASLTAVSSPQGRIETKVATYNTTTQARLSQTDFCQWVRNRYRQVLLPGAVQGILECRPTRLRGVKSGLRAVTYYSEWGKGGKALTSLTVWTSGAVKYARITTQSTWRGLFAQQPKSLRRATRAAEVFVRNLAKAIQLQ